MTDTLDALRALDTPTVCNALELVAPGRRGWGYTTEPLVCARPSLPPMVGYARTATIRATQPSGRSRDDDRDVRVAYYRHVADALGPTIAVLEDIDPSPGYGSFWGVVNSNLHRGLGCIGGITDGSIRDLDDLADGFQLLADRVGPSHAYIHVVDVAVPVSVAGMRVAPDDLIHADQHGAVVVPADLAAAVPEAAANVAAREAVLIEASRQPGFDIDRLLDLM